jgi:glycolate oxidase FAD binding subunit
MADFQTVPHSMTNSHLKPADADQALDAVRWAVAEEEPIEVAGRGTKRTFGRPFQTTHTLDLSELTGVTLYEPEELVLSARAGTPLAEIETMLAEKRQQLAFEPNDLGPLLGGEAGRQTLGGVIACNLGGPRRIAAGAARDHMLGCRGISGRGEAFKAGGRVVKNVTGYDLPKLLTGSFGTLAVLTDITVKVLPAPGDVRTVLIHGLADDAGIFALSGALQTSFEVSGAAHLPAGAAAAIGVPEVAGIGAAVTAVRLEGFGPSVAYRAGKLRDLLARHGAITELEAGPSRALWRAIRDVRPFWVDPIRADPGRFIWKLSVPPSQGARVVATITTLRSGEAFYDWGGGAIWLALDPVNNAGHGGAGQEVVRGAIGSAGGYATLIRAPETVRAAADVFQPQPRALAGLTARVKESFDPKRILNPGRMYAGV